MVKNVPCAWHFICKASSNTLCTLFVQTNSSTCNCETPQSKLGKLDDNARPHFSLGLRNYHWSTSSRKQRQMITGSQYLFDQPTLFCSFTLLPFRSKNRATSAWPFCAALKSGVMPVCKWNEGDTIESDGIDQLVVYHINLYTYTRYKTGVVLTIHIIKRFTQLKYKCPCLLCPCSRCVQRGHKMHQRSRKECTPTLSLAFTSNLCDFTRYSTMDSWPQLAATCKAVLPSWSESKRWPFILVARYLATARWPSMAHKRKALRPICIE